MSTRIALIQGHPDPSGHKFGNALSDAYRHGAESAGHEVRLISVASMDFPLLRTQEEWEEGVPPPSIASAQDTIRWATHLVIFYPLWLGSMPALLKGFFEQVFRPGFAIHPQEEGRPWAQLLKGKSARIVVTMGMPPWIYRWFFSSHSLKSLERNILGFSGIGPIQETLIGSIGSLDEKKREAWLRTLEDLGKKAQ